MEKTNGATPITGKVVDGVIKSYGKLNEAQKFLRQYDWWRYPRKHVETGGPLT